MELNLRKARKIESGIQTHLDTSKPGAAIAAVRVLGTIDDAKANLEKARAELLAKLPVREELLKLRFQIRRQIEIVNEKVGINALINQKVLTDAMSRDLATIPNVAGPDGLELEDTFNHQVEQYKAPVTDRYSSKSTSFAINAMKKQDIEAVATKKLQYKKQIQTIEDSIGEKNIIGKVTLTEDDVKLLESIGLL